MERDDDPGERELRGISQVHGDRMGTSGGIGLQLEAGRLRERALELTVWVLILALPLTISGIRTSSFCFLNSASSPVKYR